MLLHAQNTIMSRENTIIAKIIKTGFSNNKITLNNKIGGGEACVAQ